MTADSSGLAGARPFAWICAALADVVQSSLVAMTAPSEERTTVSVGLASALATPAAASEGPVAVMTTVLLAVPPMMRPPISTLSPTPTRPRVERLEIVDDEGEVATGTAAAVPVIVCVIGPA